MVTKIRKEKNQKGLMPTGIYDRTKSKPNSGIFRKGEHPSPETQFKKGQRVSPGTEFKVGAGNGLKHGHGRYSLADYLEKQRQSHAWQKHSEPSKIQKDTRFRSGCHYAPDTEFKLGQPQIYNPLGNTRPEFAGINHPNWRGGISSIKSTIRNSGPYHEWRIKVFKKDNYTCQMCGTRGGKLNAHHEIPFSDAPLFIFDVNNGKTLCFKCHKIIHEKGVI